VSGSEDQQTCVGGNIVLSLEFCPLLFGGVDEGFQELGLAFVVGNKHFGGALHADGEAA
jgi:hypothetical protein|tara:strand:- start:725 stop:901 length:177 start_codon:yes stop_codon:yes gene_type:complete